MSFMKSIIKPLAIQAYSYHAEPRLPKLYRINRRAAVRIAIALNEALKNNLDTGEKKFVDKIEQKREQFKKSKTEISITDYGAGTSKSTCTDSLIYKGVTATKKIGETCQISSKPYFWSLLLFKLIREIKPSVAIELGTSLRILGAYQAAAQKANNIGRLITLKGSSSLASIAEKNFLQLGLDKAQEITGLFKDYLNRVLNESSPVDYAFIEGNHDEKATISYFKQVTPHLSPSAILVFDDIRWSEGMHLSWKHIEEDKRVKISLNMGAVGICGVR